MTFLIKSWDMYFNCMSYMFIISFIAKTKCNIFISSISALTHSQLTELWICRPSPQFCYHIYERCGMYWNEWKINFQIFIFRVIAKIHWKLEWWRHKNDHNSKNKNMIHEFSFYSADCGYFMLIWSVWIFFWIVMFWILT